MNTREFAQDAETIISASVKVEGDFVSEGNVLIEGSVEGSLRTQKDLRVGERAKIAANVTAANAIIAGEVKGNVTVAECLELEATARVQGDVTTKVLIVASGAMINGKLTMSEGATPAEVRATPAATRRARAIQHVEEEEEAEAPAPAAHKEEEKVAAGVESERKSFNPFFTN